MEFLTVFLPLRIFEIVRLPINLRLSAEKDPLSFLSLTTTEIVVAGDAASRRVAARRKIKAQSNRVMAGVLGWSAPPESRDETRFCGCYERVIKEHDQARRSLLQVDGARGVNSPCSSLTGAAAAAADLTRC